MKSNINWGIIGVGDVCEVKSAPAMNKIPHSSIVAVMRRNEEKVKDYAARHGISQWYTEADPLINHPEVNAIYIATPPGSHLEYVKKAALAGKDVYVEKPMGRTYAECEEMISICQQNKVKLAVAYFRRTLPNYQKVKELINSEAIGEVRFVDISLINAPNPSIIANKGEGWRTDPAIAGGGYFFDLASHQLDFLDFLFGPIVKVHALSSNQAGFYATEDIVLGSFEFENHVKGIGKWCFTSSESSVEDQIRIIGSKGEISFPCFGNNHVKLKTSEGIEETFKFEMPEHIQYNLIKNVVNYFLDKEAPVSTGISAARTNKVLDEFVRR